MDTYRQGILGLLGDLNTQKRRQERYMGGTVPSDPLWSSGQEFSVPQVQNWKRRLLDPTFAEKINMEANNPAPPRQYSQAEIDAMEDQYQVRDEMQRQAQKDAVDLANFRRNKISPQEKFIDPAKAQQIETDRLQRMKTEQKGLDQQNESWLTKLKQSAREKFTDPTSMALLQGGLTAMNPNSYYDPKGFYSVAEGLNRGLGQGVKTFRQLSKPIEPTFQEQQDIIQKNKMEQIGLANQGRVPSLINSYNMAKAQGFEGTLLDYQVMLKQAGRAVTNINMPGETHGSKKFDETAGKGIAEYLMTGGATDSMKQMAQLQDVSNDLNLIAQGKSGKNLTGAILGFWPKGVRSFFNPESVNTQDLVEEVVQRNLKAILGAQFAKSEGEQLIERAYNPKLEEGINAPRIARLLQQMKLAHEQKQAMVKHFMQFKTMDGFEGHIPTMEDFTKLNLDNPNYNYTPQTQGGGVVFTDADRARQKELREMKKKGGW